MSYSVPGSLRVEKDVVARVIRRLHGQGEFNVSVGAQIAPDDILGSSTVSAGFRMLSLAKLLSVAPPDVEKYLTRKIGEKIYQGELLASKKAWFPQGKIDIVSPTDGILDFLNLSTGELKISFLPKKVDLPAGVYGIVEIVDKARGQVVIRTQVSRVYGMFGSGRGRDGILHMIDRRDAIISKNKLEPRFEGLILAGGSIFLKDTISSAISVGVTGIIAGGLQAADFRSMAGGRLIFPRKLENDVGISVIACEGFGALPMGEDIYELLSQYEGKFVFIDGNHATMNLPVTTSVSIVKIKNTQLPPIENVIKYAFCRDNIFKLTIGASVRIVGNSYLGEQGKLIGIDASLTRLPSSVSSYLVTVETSKRKIKVPVENIQLIM